MSDESDEYDSLRRELDELRMRLDSAYASDLSDTAIQDYDDQEDPISLQAGDDGGDWSFKVEAGTGLSISVAAGLKRVIHISQTAHAAFECTVPDDATSDLWIKYTYGTGWGDFCDDAAATPTLAALPSEAVTYRLFHIARVVAAGGVITSIVHRHLGDLEVYDIESC